MPGSIGDTNHSPKPPAQIEPYVSVLGVDGTIDFLLEFGGAELYLTANPKNRSRLVRLIGRDRSVALAHAAERLPARVPLAKPWLAAVFKSKGLSNAEIARRLHVTDVTVRSYLEKARLRADGKEPPRQLPLF